MATKRKTRAKVTQPIAEPIIATPFIEPIEVATPEIVSPVLLSSLQVGNEFEYGGVRYRRLETQAGKIVALHLINPELGWIGVRKVAFEPSIMVIPK